MVVTVAVTVVAVTVVAVTVVVMLEGGEGSQCGAGGRGFVTKMMSAHRAGSLDTSARRGLKGRAAAGAGERDEISTGVRRLGGLLVGKRGHREVE